MSYSNKLYEIHHCTRSMGSSIVVHKHWFRGTIMVVEVTRSNLQSKGNVLFNDALNTLSSIVVHKHWFRGEIMLVEVRNYNGFQDVPLMSWPIKPGMNSDQIQLAIEGKCFI